jgi:hypothetical protein
MQITQQDVDAIIAKAKASDLGLGDGLTHKQGHNQISQHATPDLKALALLLVDGYDEKYDLVSVFGAALQHVREKSLIEGANANA